MLCMMSRETDDKLGLLDAKMKHWTLDDIDWQAFDPSRIDPEIVSIVKSASLVEHNGADYATYLSNVFADDPDFQNAVRIWADEEVQHGRALARWAALADPTFDFDNAFARFVAGFRLPLEATESVRGTRAGELVARCIVETGTSSYYSALAEASDEPVLKQICHKIAADEFRHYKLFYDYLKRYLEKDGIGRFRRLMVALGRIGESEDDELAYAYFAANAPADTVYRREIYAHANLSKTFNIYRPHHYERVVAMTMKAAGLKSRDGIRRALARLVKRIMDWRITRLARAAG